MRENVDAAGETKESFVLFVLLRQFEDITVELKGGKFRD